jgi:hypothetical protein
MSDDAPSPILLSLDPRDIECLALAMSFVADCASTKTSDAERSQSLGMLLDWWDALYTDDAFNMLLERIDALLPTDTRLIRERNLFMVPQPRQVQ